MNKEALLALADLDKDTSIKYDDFNLAIWGRHIEETCGFAGCMIGHGWHKKIVPDDIVTVDPPKRLFDGTIIRVIDVSWEALTTWLDISEDDASYLFSPASYTNFNPAIGEVAARIRDFVDRGDQPSPVV